MQIKDRSLKKPFTIRIVILGEPGTGKTIVQSTLYKALKDLGYPVGLDEAYEHEIVTTLTDK